VPKNRNSKCVWWKIVKESFCHEKIAVDLFGIGKG